MEVGQGPNWGCSANGRRRRRRRRTINSGGSELHLFTVESRDFGNLRLRSEDQLLIVQYISSEMNAWCLFCLIISKTARLTGKVKGS
jgi:hypothetical protein